MTHLCKNKVVYRDRPLRQATEQGILSLHHIEYKHSASVFLKKQQASETADVCDYLLCDDIIVQCLIFLKNRVLVVIFMKCLAPDQEVLFYGFS